MSLSSFSSLAADAGPCGAVFVFSRPSVRSLSGWVAVACFSSASAARGFAAVAGRSLPSRCGGCAVRPVSAAAPLSVLPFAPPGSLASGSLFGVSVPVLACPAPGFFSFGFGGGV